MGSLSAEKLAAAAYAEAFARAPVGMCLMGVDGIFRDANRALCKILGRERQEVIGASFLDVTHPDDIEQDYRMAAGVLRGDHELFAHEKRYVQPDGSLRWAEVDGSLIRDAHGNPVHFVFSVTDVTERRLAEELRNEHLASISHELRTPLTSIHGYAQLLLEEGDLPTPVERGSVAAIERNASAMLTVIESGSEELARLVDDHVAQSLGLRSGSVTPS